MGFDIATFRLILEGPGRFADLWGRTHIPRRDASTNGEARLGGRSLDAVGALGLVLHYLGSAILETSLQQVFALTPSTCSRYLRFAKKILRKTVCAMEEGRLGMLQTLEEFQFDLQ